MAKKGILGKADGDFEKKREEEALSFLYSGKRPPQNGRSTFDEAKTLSSCLFLFFLLVILLRLFILSLQNFLSSPMQSGGELSIIIKREGGTTSTAVVAAYQYECLSVQSLSAAVIKEGERKLVFALV